MKRVVALAGIIVLTLSLAQHGFGQVSADMKALRDEIKKLKDGQTAIQKDLQEIKTLLRTMQAQPQGPPPLKEAVVRSTPAMLRETRAGGL